MDKAQRKQLATAYKLSFPAMGIFAITNQRSGRQWIGQSRNVHGSLNRHRLELRIGSHRNAALMADWRLLGEAQFGFDLLEQLQQRAEPDFDYAAELDRRMAAWRLRVPLGSSGSYL